MTSNLLTEIKGRLIVSCQDYEDAMIPAAAQGGAAGLRLNGPQAVRFAHAHSKLPILACNKIYFPNSDVYITPSARTASSLLDAGADMVAFDARDLPRPRQSIAEMVSLIHAHGRVAVADTATLDEGLAARQQGADVIATTFSPVFSVELIRNLAQAGCRVLAEGHVMLPENVAQALAAGAWAVCVGTAITRPHLITSRFLEAIR